MFDSFSPVIHFNCCIDFQVDSVLQNDTTVSTMFKVVSVVCGIVQMGFGCKVKKDSNIFSKYELISDICGLRKMYVYMLKLVGIGIECMMMSDLML